MNALYEESERIVAQQNAALVNDAILTQAAIISCLDKKGNKQFQKLIKGLGGDAKKVGKQRRGEAFDPHKPAVKTDAIDPRVPRRKKKVRQPIPERPKK